jgi:hypothetical protein
MRILLSIEDSGQGSWKVTGPFQKDIPQQTDPMGGFIPFAPEMWPNYLEICDRNPAHIVEYGRALFDALIGAAEWQTIVDSAHQQKERLIELALAWPPTDTHLSRLHWEMMHDGNQFLAAGLVAPDNTVVDVAITRVVPQTTWTAGQVSALPRVLFVIGTSLTDATIRPGEEVMAILRGDTESEFAISTSILENATPTLVQNRVKSFQPDVVHFICHGKINIATNSGEIQVKPDPNTAQTSFDASQVWQWLSAGKKAPQIVILSACQTGTAVVDLLGPAAVAPFAAQLVSAGVPVVIAMSGRVSDLACRLFTRRFSQALAGGKTLVAATAKGRRSAIAEGNAATMSVDWGYPTVYLSQNVDADYQPGGKKRGDTGLQTRILPYQLRTSQPAFYGRNEFFQVFGELFSETKFGAVMAAFTVDDIKGYGRTRLLEELVIQALRDGHVPCAVLASQPGWKAPKNPLDVAVAIDRAMETAREALGLNTRNVGPIMLLQFLADGNLELADRPEWLVNVLRRHRWNKEYPSQISPGAIAEIIERQFLELMAEARREKPAILTENSRAVLLLDDLHDYIKEFEPIATEHKLGVWGFGTEQEPVPVVAAFSLGTATNDMTKPIAESNYSGWRALPLRAFATDKDRREDMRAYARVLMNPFTTLVANISDVAWVMDYGITPAEVNDCEDMYRRYFKGIPGRIQEEPFFLMAETAKGKRFLKEAQDRDRLRRLIDEEGGA